MNCFSCLIFYVPITYSSPNSSSVVSFDIFKHIKYSTNFTFSKRFPQDSPNSDQLQSALVFLWAVAQLLSRDFSFRSSQALSSLSVLLASLFLVPSFLVHIILMEFPSVVSWERMCEVKFWRPHIFQNTFILTLHVIINSLVRGRMLYWKSFSLRILKSLFHHLVSSVAVQKPISSLILNPLCDTYCFSLKTKGLLFVFGVLNFKMILPWYGSNYIHYPRHSDKFNRNRMSFTFKFS